MYTWAARGMERIGKVFVVGAEDERGPRGLGWQMTDSVVEVSCGGSDARRGRDCEKGKDDCCELCMIGSGWVESGRVSAVICAVLRALGGRSQYKEPVSKWFVANSGVMRAGSGRCEEVARQA